MAEPAFKAFERELPPWRAWTADSLQGRAAAARRWHVRDLIPSGTVTLLGGDGGIGKSTLALQLCFATAAGASWIGYEPTAGRALYLSAEDDSNELHRRLADVATFYGIDFDGAAGLKVCDLTDAGETLLVTASAQGVVEPTALWQHLEDEVDAWGPSLVVLDSLADFYGGNENDRGQVRQFVSMLRKLAQRSGAAVVLLGHPSLAGLSSGSGASGSTAWSNSVRSRLYLSKAEGEGADPDVRVLSTKKANYAPALTDLRLRRQGLGFALEDQIATHLDSVGAARRIDDLFLELTDAYCAEGRQVRHTTGHGYAPAVFAKDSRAQGTTKRGFEMAMNRLFAAKLIKSEEEGPPSRRVSRIVRAV